MGGGSAFPKSDQVGVNKKAFIEKWLKESRSLAATDILDPIELPRDKYWRKHLEVSEPQPFIDPEERIEAAKMMEEFDKVGHGHHAPVPPHPVVKRDKETADRLKPTSFMERVADHIGRDSEAGLSPQEIFCPPLYPFGKHFYENTKPGGSFSAFEFFLKHDPRAQKK